MTLPKDILPQVTAGELDAFSTIGGEERLIAFVNRFRELERERIIKLLEDECSSDWPKVIEMPLGNLIALIREE